MRVLVPVEDPFFAACLVDFINHHEWPDKTEFLVMHVIEPYNLDGSTQVAFAPLLDISPNIIIEEAAQMVAKISQAINNANPTATVTQEVVEAHVAEQIKRVAQRWPADLLIMGSHGRSGFSHFVLGSTSLELANDLRMPLLLVKPNKESLKAWDDLDYPSVTHLSFEESLFKLAKNRKSQKVLIALDDTELSEQVVDFCLNHKWSSTSEFKLFSTIDERPFFFLPTALKQKLSTRLLEYQQNKLNRYAQSMIERFGTEKVGVEVQQGAPRTSILAMAQKWNAGLLVVGSHSQKSGACSGGRVAIASLCAAPCSVLLVREHTADKKSAVEHTEQETPNYEPVAPRPRGR